MKPIRAAAITLVIAAITLPLSVRADFIFYDDPTSFTTDAPGLATETFESARLPAGTFLGMTGTFDSATQGTWFPEGTVLPGFVLNEVQAVPSDFPELFVAGTGAAPGGTVIVSTPGLGDSLRIDFTPNTSAAGSLLIALPRPGFPGLPVAATFQVQVTDASGYSETDNVSVSGLNTFFGVKSTTDPIAHMTISTTTPNALVAIDNLMFDAPPPPPHVPTFAEFTAAHPNLVTETFESANVAAGKSMVVTGPLTSATASPVFSAGALLPDFSISGVSLVSINGANIIPGGSKEAGILTSFSSNSNKPIILSFDQSQTAVGFNLISSSIDFRFTWGTLTDNIYDGSTLIHTENVNALDATFFYSFTSEIPFNRVEVTQFSFPGSYIFLDNITYAIPEPASVFFLLAVVPLMRGRRRGRRCYRLGGARSHQRFKQRL